jgi:hypothetical protein
VLVVLVLVVLVLVVPVLSRRQPDATRPPTSLWCAVGARRMVRKALSVGRSGVLVAVW